MESPVIASTQTQQIPARLPSTPRRPITPVAYALRFAFAVLYFFLARLLAKEGAHGLVNPDFVPLVEQAMLCFLLIFGYAGLGFSLDRQLTPVRDQGLTMRKGWLGEMGLGLAFGWGIAVACVLPILIFGGIAVHFSWSLASLGWLLIDAAYFLAATLALQVAFRGYPFQCAIRAVGELPAALLLSVLYGIVQAFLVQTWLPSTSRAAMAVNIALGLLLAMAYLRTRALWLAWGLQFGWVASRALLFGLPVNNVSSHSPVIQGDPLSSFAWSGGDYGLDASWLAFVVILIAMFFLYRATSDLSFVYNAPVLEPAGLAVDLDAAAKRQHESATRPEQPEVKPLVQIMPLSSPESMSIPSSEPPPLASDLNGPRD
jgi:membrane protease YdiL (CAAX protease family)